jgi:hypothetical protein
VSFAAILVPDFECVFCCLQYAVWLCVFFLAILCFWVCNCIVFSVVWYFLFSGAQFCVFLWSGVCDFVFSVAISCVNFCFFQQSNLPNVMFLLQQCTVSLQNP